MAKLDTVSLFIVSESENHKVEATEYAVEKGEPFIDHVAKRPSEFTISGFILSNDWEGEKNKLIALMESGTITKYVGKMQATNVVILSISGKHGSHLVNGMDIDITLRKVRITSTPWQKASGKEVAIRKPTTVSGLKKPVTKVSSASVTANLPKYHIIKKGQTYYYLSKKYGVPITQLRTWNKWPDHAIPIGGKARVG